LPPLLAVTQTKPPDCPQTRKRLYSANNQSGQAAVANVEFSTRRVFILFLYLLLFDRHGNHFSLK
jgi:hypothetical protein